MTVTEAVAYISTQHAIVRFYQDDQDGAEMVRVVIEDETGEHRTVVKKQSSGDSVKAFCAATEQAKTLFEAEMRRAKFEIV